MTEAGARENSSTTERFLSSPNSSLPTASQRVAVSAAIICTIPDYLRIIWSITFPGCLVSSTSEHDRLHVMNQGSSSSSAHRPRQPSLTSNRPSLPDRRLSRRFSAISRSESGLDVDTGPTTTEHQLTEEIAEIKRYEDFTTIDWVQDAAREQLRRRARRQANGGFYERDGHRILGWRQKLRNSYDAGQAWIVVTLVGAAIGLNAGMLNIITEWLSDIKLGYCTTGFYLNEDFCCWGEENGRSSFFFTFGRRT